MSRIVNVYGVSIKIELIDHFVLRVTNVGTGKFKDYTPSSVTYNFWNTLFWSVDDA